MKHIWSSGPQMLRLLLYFFSAEVESTYVKVNVKVLGKWLELLSANGGKFKIYQLLFADDTGIQH